MDILEKAKILTDSGNLDSCGFKACAVKVNSGLGGIYHAKAEHKTCRIFKTLMSNNCSYDCRYCKNASGCKSRKAEYSPEELTRLFMQLNRKLDVKGLFLSSGISTDSDHVTEKMIKTVELLRYKHGFNGYVHFKVLPGTSYDLIKRASELSTRMSINIEVPNRSILSELSSCKDYKIDILRRQAWISKFSLSGGQTTQFMLNKLSTDKEVLRMMDWEYSSLGLRRIYFSSFQPIKGTAMESDEPEPQYRQNYLYNTDFLIRQYGYSFKEFYKILDDGMLPKEDPKLALAKMNLDSPIDINSASYEELIRVPGIGPVTANKIISTSEKIRSYQQLDSLGARIERAKPFIEVDGKRQAMLGEFC